MGDMKGWDFNPPITSQEDIKKFGTLVNELVTKYSLDPQVVVSETQIQFKVGAELNLPKDATQFRQFKSRIVETDSKEVDCYLQEVADLVGNHFPDRIVWLEDEKGGSPDSITAFADHPLDCCFLDLDIDGDDADEDNFTRGQVYENLGPVLWQKYDPYGERDDSD